MLFLLGLYLMFNYGTQAGAGIPMATDIAFALGILSLIRESSATFFKNILNSISSNR
jgi:NhaA family Na+:H+ antiporter